MLLTGHHAAPVVTVFFRLIHVICMELHRRVVIRYSASVTCERLCHAIGHLGIYHKCYRFERGFFCSQDFFTLLYFRLFKVSLGQQLNLKVGRVSCWSSKHSPGPIIFLNYRNPQIILCWSIAMVINIGINKIFKKQDSWFSLAFFVS